MANTQTVTILFTDIVASTELSSRLDAAETDRIRQGHFSILRQSLAENGGAEVKNLGDGLMAVFSSPSGAVNCAVAMQQAVEQDNRRSSYPLGLRVGMSCGETTVEDDDYFGEPVVEASRICALCEGGQILVRETVKILAGRRCPHPITDVGDRDLKGLSEPVSVCEVQWEPVPRTTGVPLPDRLELPSASLFGFVGRQRELERLSAGVKHAIEGEKTVALLSGEPGIGKTSLCRQLAKSSHDVGVCVLYGRCDEDLGASYQPFAEALTHLVVYSDESLLASHVTEHGGALLSLVPALAKRLPGIQLAQSADPDSERVRLFGAVVSLLSSASAECGVLLFLDDLHWADKASLQLVRHLCASNQIGNVMVVGTYRDSELSAGDALSDALASMSREAQVERFDLTGLEDVEIIAMMEGVAGHDMDQDGVDLAHAVKRETEGNPFFTTELLRHLGETGLVYQDDAGRWVASEDLYEKGMPQSVRQVVGQRVDRLGEDTRKLLSQAAVIGREFDIDVLTAVSGIDDDAVIDVVDKGVQAGLLVEVEGRLDRYSFAHALTQHTLYEDLGPSRRSRTHRNVADVLEQLYGSAPETRASELAHHFLAATKTTDAIKALTYCKLAGDQALAHVAPADALGWFSQAIELYGQVSPDEELRCDLLIKLGTAQRRTGDPAHRVTLLEAASIAQALGDRDRLVAAALANSRSGASATGRVDGDKVAVLKAALGVVGAGDSGERVGLLATLAAELSYGTDPDEYSTYRTEALDMARRLDDPVSFLAATGAVYADSYTPDTVADRLTDLARAVSLADSLGDLKASCGANFNRAVACIQVADRAGFDHHLAVGTTTAMRAGDAFEQWRLTILQSMRSNLTGDLDRSRAEAEAAFSLGNTGVAEAIAAYAAQLIDIDRVAGHRNELNEMAELMAAQAVANPELAILRAALARSYCDLGRDDDALLAIEGDLENRFLQFGWDATWVSSMTSLSEVCLHLARLDGAALVYERLAPWHAQVSTAMVTVQGPIALHLGNLAALLGRDVADAHFVEALEVAHRLGSPYWIARTQIDWTQWTHAGVATGPENSKGLLANALRTARRHGFVVLVERAESLA